MRKKAHTDGYQQLTLEFSKQTETPPEQERPEPQATEQAISSQEPETAPEEKRPEPAAPLAAEQPTPPPQEEPTHPTQAAAVEPVERDPERIKPGDIILAHNMAVSVVKVNRVSFSCVDLQETQPSHYKVLKSALEKRLYTAAEWKAISQAERDRLIPGKHPIHFVPTWTWIPALIVGRPGKLRVLGCGTYTAHLDIWPDPRPNGYKPAIYTSYVCYAHIELINEPQPPHPPADQEREEAQAEAEPEE